MSSAWWGPILVGLAALLWASDTPFRYPIVSKVDPTLIVLFEHLVGTLLLGTWVLFKRGRSTLKLSPRQWAAVAFVGLGGSALATTLFTASFRYVNPSVTILLQKLQPVAVVLIASVALGERPERRFFLWAAVALAAAIALAVPSLDLTTMLKLELQSKGVLYALGAAGIWAVGTVIGKAVLKGQPSDVVAFWRYGFGGLGLGAIVTVACVSGGSAMFVDSVQRITTSPELLRPLAYVSLIPGVLAMVIYYAGLSRTSASIATFVELLYPVGAVLLNTLVLNLPLAPAQAVAGLVLLFAVTQISR